jgi:hypothetical protein
LAGLATQTNPRQAPSPSKVVVTSRDASRRRQPMLKCGRRNWALVSGSRRAAQILEVTAFVYFFRDLTKSTAAMWLKKRDFRFSLAILVPLL